MDQSVESRGSVARNATERQEMPEHQVELRTLAPAYNKDQHGIYVRHLEDAIREKKNRNIALTGRYGSGKSSVLDAFEEKHERSTVRISINTLGPDEEDKDLTNRIQKELVKQLVYRLKPGQIRRSRFARPKPLTKWRAFVQALGVSAVGLTLLWLLGVRPPTGSPAAQASTAAQSSRRSGAAGHWSTGLPNAEMRSTSCSSRPRPGSGQAKPTSSPGSMSVSTVTARSI